MEDEALVIPVHRGHQDVLNASKKGISLVTVRMRKLGVVREEVEVAVDSLEEEGIVEVAAEGGVDGLSIGTCLKT